MRRTVPLALLGTMAALALQGCDSIIDYRGFAPTPGSVEKLEAGTQSDGGWRGETFSGRAWPGTAAAGASQAGRRRRSG